MTKLSQAQLDATRLAGLRRLYPEWTEQQLRQQMLAAERRRTAANLQPAPVVQSAPVVQPAPPLSNPDVIPRAQFHAAPFRGTTTKFLDAADMPRGQWPVESQRISFDDPEIAGTRIPYETAQGAPPPLQSNPTASLLNPPPAAESTSTRKPLSDSAFLGLLGLSQGLLQAGQWSPVPVSNAGALGRGIRGGMQGYVQGREMDAARTRADRAEELYPYQLAVQRAAAAKADHDIRLQQNWGAIVQSSGATPAEQQKLMQVGSRAGFPALQGIVARGQRRQLSNIQRESLPPQLKQLQPFMYTTADGQIKLSIDDTMAKQIIAAGQGGYKNDPELKKELGLPDNTVVMTHSSDPKETPFIRNIATQSLPREAHENVLRAQEDVRSGRRTMEEVQDDPAYAMHYARLYGKQTPYRYIGEDGQVMQGLTNPSPPPSGFIRPRDAATSAATQGAAQALTKPTTTPARKTTLRKTLQSLEESKSLIAAHRKLMSETDDTLGFMPKTSHFAAEISNITIMLQDKLKDMAGYGAPQAAELERLAQMLGNPSDLSLHQYWKSGGNEREYVNSQLDLIETSLKTSEQEVRKELGWEPAAPWGTGSTQDTETSTMGLSAQQIESRIPSQ